MVIFVTYPDNLGSKLRRNVDN